VLQSLLEFGQLGPAHPPVEDVAPNVPQFGDQPTTSASSTLMPQGNPTTTVGQLGGTTPYDEALNSAIKQRESDRAAVLGGFDQPPGVPPQPTRPAWRTEDLIGGLLPALIMSAFDKHGHGTAAFVKGYLGAKDEKAAQDTAHGQQVFQQGQIDAQRQLQRAEAALSFSNQDVQQLQGEKGQYEAEQRQQDQYNQRVADADRKQRGINGRMVRAQYLQANTPSEKISTARILREQFPEYAPTDSEVQRDVETLSMPEAKQFNDDLRKFHDATYFQDDSTLKGEMAKYAARRGELVAAGVPDRLLDPIPDTKSLKQFRAQAIKDYRDQQLKLAQDRFSFDKLKHKDQLEVQWANHDLAVQNFGLAAQRNQIGMMKLYADQMSDQAKRIAGAIKGRVDVIQKQMAQRSNQLQKQGFGPDEIAKDSVIQGYTKQIQDYQSSIDEQNDELSQAGQPPLTMSEIMNAAAEGIKGTAKSGLSDNVGPSSYKTLITASARKAGIPASFLDAIIHAESSYNASSVSKAGARGIAQLMPDTAAGMGVDPMDPKQAIPAAARILAANLRKYNGDYALAAAAYNAGSGAVDKYGGKVPPYDETQAYVKRVAGLAGFTYDPATQGHAPQKPTGGGHYGNPHGPAPKKPNGLELPPGWSVK